MQGDLKNRSPEEDSHGNGTLGMRKESVKNEALRKAVMEMGYWGYSLMAIRIKALRKIVMGMGRAMQGGHKS